MEQTRNRMHDLPAGDPKLSGTGKRLREIVGVYPTYAEAQAAVDFLSDSGFDVKRVAIVAEGLSFVEQVTGRLGWGRALLNGATSGGAIGAVIGFVFGLFNFFAPLVSALSLAFWGLLFGALVGALFGLIAYALSGGKRDFTSVSGVQAERYEVAADPEAADEARRLIERMPVERKTG